MCFGQRGSNVLFVGSADDACGGWTSTSPPPKTIVVSGDPGSFQSCQLSPSAFEWSFPGRNFTLNE